jgi:hypothetical protein
MEDVPRSTSFRNVRDWLPGVALFNPSLNGNGRMGRRFLGRRAMAAFLRLFALHGILLPQNPDSF